MLLDYPDVLGLKFKKYRETVAHSNNPGVTKVVSATLSENKKITLINSINSKNVVKKKQTFTKQLRIKDRTTWSLERSVSITLSESR